MYWVNLQYKNNLKKYVKKDGLKALIVYCIIMCSAFFQGWLYTTNATVFILNLSQILIPLILVTAFLCFFCYSKKSIKSVGIHSDNIKSSIVLGFTGGFVLLAIQTILFIVQGKSVSFTNPSLLNWMIFLFAAFEEEILFRGYIQTRMAGLINNQLIVSIINSILFLSIHYPVRWVVSGIISLSVLSTVYIVSLLLLHFFCDAAYKRTNCLWGSILLHVIYNAVGAIILIQ